MSPRPQHHDDLWQDARIDDTWHFCAARRACSRVLTITRSRQGAHAVVAEDERKLAVRAVRRLPRGALREGRGHSLLDDPQLHAQQLREGRVACREAQQPFPDIRLHTSL